MLVSSFYSQVQFRENITRPVEKRPKRVCSKRVFMDPCGFNSSPGCRLTSAKFEANLAILSQIQVHQILSLHCIQRSESRKFSKLSFLYKKVFKKHMIFVKWTSFEAFVLEISERHQNFIKNLYFLCQIDNVWEFHFSSWDCPLSSEPLFLKTTCLVNNCLPFLNLLKV